MSFLSGLSNIFHSIGHVLTGGDDEDQKKKQQQQQQQARQQAAVVRPTQNPAQNNVVQATQQPVQAPKPQVPNVNLSPTLLQKVQQPNPGAIIPPQSSYDPNSPLIKLVNQQNAQPVAPVNKNSTGYKITHNPVTNFLGGIVKPTAEFGHAVVETPHAIVREIQNKPINDIQQNVFGTTDQGKILKKIVGDTVNTGLLVAAPGVDSLAETGVKTAAGETAAQLSKAAALKAAGVSAQDALRMAAQDTASTALTKIAPRVIAGSTVGGAQGATSTYSEGGDLKQIAKSAGENALIGGATAGFFAGIPVLAKAVKDGHITPQEADGATKVADGVHTVNPNRPTDAADQLGVPHNGAPGSVADVQPAAAPVSAAQPVNPAQVPAPAQPLVPEQVTKAPAPVETPVLKPGKQPQAPNAPGIRAAAQKKLDSLAGNAGDPTQHDVLSNADLLQAGKEHADTFNDTQLVNHFKNGFNPTDAGDVARGHAALERLNEIAKANPKNKSAAQAIDNILSGAEQGISKGGRVVNYAQQFYDGLKGPAKTNYLIRQIDKVREANGQSLLRDDEEAMKAATEKVQSHVDAEEANKAKIATLEQRLEEIKTEAENGNGSKELTKEANDINGAIKQQQLAMSKNTSELGKFYDSVAPIKQGTQQKVGDLGRSLMLSSIAGRGNDIATTGINAGHSLLQQTLEAAAGKLTKTPGKVIDTLPSPAAIGRGMKFGLQKSRERFKGNVAAGDASALLKKVDTGSGKGQLLSKTDGTLLSKVVAPVHRVVRSATELATDLSEGIKESRVQQLAAQQGKQAGLKGENLKSWTAAQTASPSKALTDAGNQLRDEVNNMQDNKLSDALDKIAKGLGHIPVVGEQVRNLTLPFTRWTGGAIHNAVTDKNVIANIAQLTKAATKGDQQGMITAASKLGVNGVGSIGAGYTLAKAGLITHQNAQGYNDDGAYLHIGNRYIPAGFLGFFAPGIIMGSAAHDAMSKTDANGKHGSIVSQVLNTTEQTLINGAKSLGAQSLTGESNPTLIALQNAGKNGYGDVAATAGGQVAGSYIPAVTGDVNAVLNQTGLNPTHEAALTKVEKGASGVVTKKGKPSTAKDVPATVKNQLLNKVPFASQKLPRNPGVGANDEFDRLTRGDHETATQLKTKADATTAANVSADLAKRGVPDPNATYKTGDSFDKAVQNRIENGKYDQAIEGLQAKIDSIKKGPDPTQKEINQYQTQIDHIKLMQDGSGVTQKGGIVYETDSDGKVVKMEQKDFDYKAANDQITSAKNSGDVTGHQDGQAKLLGNISWQLHHATLTPQNRDALVQKAVQAQEEYAKVQQYGGFTKPKDADPYATPTFTNAKPTYVKTIQEMGAKYGVDINALLSVAAQEGLGGGVGDNGHAFGPFQMNDAGGVLTGKFKSGSEAQAYAESPAGIEDAVQQIAKVAAGKTGAEAIKAIVTQFERSADQPKEIANALALYSGGKAVLSDSGGVASQTGSDASIASAKKAASDAQYKITSNKLSSTPNLPTIDLSNLSPTKINTTAKIPTIQQVQSGDLIKKRAISVSRTR